MGLGLRTFQTVKGDPDDDVAKLPKYTENTFLHTYLYTLTWFSLLFEIVVKPEK